MSNQSPYKAEDWVTGTLYEINENIGAFVAVDHKYYGDVYKRQGLGLNLVLGSKIKIGNLLPAVFLPIIACVLGF